MNNFSTRAIAEIYCKRVGLPIAAIYTGYVMGVDGLRFIVKLP